MVHQPTQASSTMVATKPEFEAAYLGYCARLKALTQSGSALADLKRAPCWLNLQRLHRLMPSFYESPMALHIRFRKGGEADVIADPLTRLYPWLAA